MKLHDTSQLECNGKLFALILASQASLESPITILAICKFYSIMNELDVNHHEVKVSELISQIQV